MTHKINELFDAPAPWTADVNGQSEFYATFVIEGREFMFTALQDEFLKGYDNKVWRVEFRNNSVKDQSQAYSITGDGNSTAVMSTVIDIMNTFVRKYEVRIMIFSADEPSRKKLYLRLIRTMLKGWQVMERNDEYTVISQYATRNKDAEDDDEQEDGQDGEYRSSMNPYISEEQVSRSDAKEIFKQAADYNNKPSGLGKIFKSLRKDKLDVNDLQRAWADAGYPDDTRDINSILSKHGFDKKAINKVFSGVFGKQSNSDEYEPMTQSPVIQKIAKYAIDNGIAEELKQFLESEYGFKESVNYGKAVVEDIRQIFTAIVNEERTGTESLIKEYHQTSLGRHKK